MTGPRIVFLVNLLQDVNIIRPLALMAARDLNITPAVLVSAAFRARDRTGVWGAELDRLAAETGAHVHNYSGEYEAFQQLQGQGGALIAASESSLAAHAETHTVFRVAPAGFVKVTLQHGFECVGFLQNRDHDKSHGRDVRFGADIVAGWCTASKMRAMGPSERPKLFVTGPGAVLQSPSPTPDEAIGEGLICENLHSVRLNASGDLKTSFMDVFFDYSDRLAQMDARITLRPHPGGQYVVKNKVALPPNVGLDNRPIYDVDLSAYRYGVSAPSSVVIDMVLAGIPTAVWRDAGGVMDTRNYEGLTTISGLNDWLAFRRDALMRPELILDRQSRFLQALGMPVEPQDVRRRFLALLTLALGPSGAGASGDATSTALAASVT